MPIVLIGLLLLFVEPIVGIFVIILGVMVWTSRKSREAMRRADQARPPQSEGRDKSTELPEFNFIPVRNDLPDDTRVGRD